MHNQRNPSAHIRISEAGPFFAINPEGLESPRRCPIYASQMLLGYLITEIINSDIKPGFNEINI